LDSLARLRQVAGAADHLVGLVHHLLDRAAGLLDDGALLVDVQRQVIHRTVQLGGALAQLFGHRATLLVSLREHLAKVGQAAEHRADMLVQAVDVHRAAVVLALELLDLLDHHLAQAGELLDLPTQEERLEFTVVGDEVVGVFVVEVVVAVGAEEEHRGQRLVEIEAEDLAEGRVAGHRHVVEHRVHAAECLLVVQPAQDAVVEDAHQRLAGLVAHELLIVAAGGFGQRRALDHDQLLTWGHVAEQVDSFVGEVDLRNRTDEHLLADADGEGIVGEPLFQLLRHAPQRLAQRLDHAANVAAGIDHLADVAILQGGAEHAQAERRGLEVLALEHPEADVTGALEKDDQCVVLVAALAVVQLRALEIQLAARRAADEQTGEAPGLVQGFHEERLRGGQAVEEDVGQGVAVVDLHRYLNALDRCREPGDALAHGQALALAADILALQRYPDDLRGRDDAGVEQLQYHPIPLRAGGAVEPLALAGQLAGSGAQADRRPWKALRYLPRDSVQVDVRRDETGDVCRLEAQGR